MNAGDRQVFGVQQLEVLLAVVQVKCRQVQRLDNRLGFLRINPANLRQAAGFNIHGLTY
jgi:hypothetical protein